MTLLQMNTAVFNRIVLSWILLAAVTFVLLFFFSAPYGRHHRKGWGPAMGRRLGWLVMEVPSLAVFLACFLVWRDQTTFVAVALLLIWGLHYGHRALIYPFSLRKKGRSMPVFVVAMGGLFNVVNALLNGYYIFFLSDKFSDRWLTDPRFGLGVGLAVVGFVINRWADLQLQKVRSAHPADYVILDSGLFRLVSCPNYFGEILIWIGWAVATWSLPGLSFAIWTMANLVPRAWKHHLWYRHQFPDYPPERKALLPWVW